ncbi:hypothetical protein DFJ73DRAFT_844841, partial [Zopfochytrium polystomum]
MRRNSKYSLRVVLDHSSPPAASSSYFVDPSLQPPPFSAASSSSSLFYPSAPSSSAASFVSRTSSNNSNSNNNNSNNAIDNLTTSASSSLGHRGSSPTTSSSANALSSFLELPDINPTAYALAHRTTTGNPANGEAGPSSQIGQGQRSASASGSLPSTLASSSDSSRRPHIVLLTGKVILSLQKPLTNAEELVLHTRGRISVDVTSIMNFLNPDIGGVQPVTRQLVQHDATLWRRTPQDPKDLPPGDHEWTFALPLQSILPPSVELQHGRIEYTMKAKLTRKGLSSDISSSPVPIHILRARPRGSVFKESILRDDEKLFRVKANVPEEAFLGDDGLKIILEITPTHPDVIGCLRSVKVFIKEKRSYSCGITGKTTMFKDEAILGKGAKYLIDDTDESQYSVSVSARQERHAELNFPLAQPINVKAETCKLVVFAPLTDANPSITTYDLRVSHRLHIRLDMDPTIYEGPSVQFDLPLTVVAPSRRRPLSWREGLPVKLPFSMSVTDGEADGLDDRPSTVERTDAPSPATTLLGQGMAPWAVNRDDDTESHMPFAFDEDNVEKGSNNETRSYQNVMPKSGSETSKGSKSPLEFGTETAAGASEPSHVPIDSSPALAYYRRKLSNAGGHGEVAAAAAKAQNPLKPALKIAANRGTTKPMSPTSPIAPPRINPDTLTQTSPPPSPKGKSPFNATRRPSVADRNVNTPKASSSSSVKAVVVPSVARSATLPASKPNGAPQDYPQAIAQGNTNGLQHLPTYTQPSNTFQPARSQSTSAVRLVQPVGQQGIPLPASAPIQPQQALFHPHAQQAQIHSRPPIPIQWSDSNNMSQRIPASQLVPEAVVMASIGPRTSSRQGTYPLTVAATALRPPQKDSSINISPIPGPANFRSSPQVQPMTEARLEARHVPGPRFARQPALDIGPSSLAPTSEPVVNPGLPAVPVATASTSTQLYTPTSPIPITTASGKAGSKSNYPQPQTQRQPQPLPQPQSQPLPRHQSQPPPQSKQIPSQSTQQSQQYQQLQQWRTAGSSSPAGTASPRPGSSQKGGSVRRQQATPEGAEGGDAGASKGGRVATAEEEDDESGWALVDDVYEL